MPAGLEALLDLLPEVVLRLDPHGQILYLNRPWATLTGRTPEETLGAPLERFLAPDSQRELRALLAAPQEEGRCDLSLEPLEGEPRAVALYVHREERGGFLGTLWDITEQRLAEVEIARAVASLEGLFAAFPDAFFRLGPEGVIWDLRPGSAAVLPGAVDDYQGRPLREALPPAMASALLEAADAARRSGAQGRIECAMPGAPPLEARLLPYEAEDVLVLLRDISERKAAEQALREARDAAEAATRAKSDFLATVSHEIRTPLSGLLGEAGLLLDTAMNSVQRQHAESIVSCGQALLGLINDVVDFSRLEAGRLSLEPAPLALRELFEDTVGLLARQAHDKGLELVLSTPGPPAPEQFLGDPGRLRQVLLYLLGNAIKFTERGEVLVQVALTPAPEQGPEAVLLEVEVADSGIGISDELAGRLFQPFTQADASSTRRFGGVGLGLTNARALVELLGGTLSLKSAPGEGSRFRFSARLTALPAPAPPAPLRGPPVLCVDDHPQALRQLQRQVTALGLCCDAAASGVEALDRALRALGEGRPYGLLLIDDRMPALTGRELSRMMLVHRELRELRRVLLCSALSRPAGEELRELGFQETLLKPVRWGALRELLSGVAHAPEAATAPAEPAQAPRPQPLAEPPVLVVDDVAVNRKIVLGMLAKLGCKADAAENGVEALERVRRRSAPYRLIIMDCQMPEMDGYQCTQAVRALSGPAAETPIVALTANAMEGDRQRCAQVGMNDYLAKPLKVDVLRALLDRWAPGLR